jgi:hypothetical protein
VSATVEFEETQRFRQPWVWALVLLVLGGLSTYLWVGFFRQVTFGKPFGDHPAPDMFLLAMVVMVTLINLAVFLLFASMRLTVRTLPSGLHIRFFPVRTLEIPYREIQRVEAREYNPLREFGGWGMKYSWDLKTKAFTISGKQGVELHLKDGHKVMIGSQRAEELTGALSRRLEAFRSAP